MQAEIQTNKNRMLHKWSTQKTKTIMELKNMTAKNLKQTTRPAILSGPQAAAQKCSILSAWNHPVSFERSSEAICFSPPHHQYSAQDHCHLLPVFQKSLWTPVLPFSKHVQRFAAFGVLLSACWHLVLSQVWVKGHLLCDVVAPHNCFLGLHL